MSHTYTHTFAILQVSPSAYQEIRAKLEEAGYSDQFTSISGRGECIDMHGIALQKEPGRCKECNCLLCVCEKCEAEWCLDHQPNPLVCPKCGGRYES